MNGWAQEFTFLLNMRMRFGGLKIRFGKLPKMAKFRSLLLLELQLDTKMTNTWI